MMQIEQNNRESLEKKNTNKYRGLFIRTAGVIIAAALSGPMIFHFDIGKQTTKELLRKNNPEMYALIANIDNKFDFWIADKLDPTEITPQIIIDIDEDPDEELISRDLKRTTNNFGDFTNTLLIPQDLVDKALEAEERNTWISVPGPADGSIITMNAFDPAVREESLPDGLTDSVFRIEGMEYYAGIISQDITNKHLSILGNGFGEITNDKQYSTILPLVVLTHPSDEMGTFYNPDNLDRFNGSEITSGEFSTSAVFIVIDPEGNLSQVKGNEIYSVNKDSTIVTTTHNGTLTFEEGSFVSIDGTAGTFINELMPSLDHYDSLYIEMIVTYNDQNFLIKLPYDNTTNGANIGAAIERVIEEHTGTPIKDSGEEAHLSLIDFTYAANSGFLQTPIVPSSINQFGPNTTGFANKHFKNAVFLALANN